MASKVLIQMQGGVIQAIFVDNTEVEVIVQDFDEVEDGIVHQLDTGEEFSAYIDLGILNPDLVNNIHSVAEK